MAKPGQHVCSCGTVHRIGCLATGSSHESERYLCDCGVLPPHIIPAGNVTLPLKPESPTLASLKNMAEIMGYTFEQSENEIRMIRPNGTVAVIARR